MDINEFHVYRMTCIALDILICSETVLYPLISFAPACFHVFFHRRSRTALHRKSFRRSLSRSVACCLSFFLFVSLVLRWTLLAGERNGNMPKKDISNKKSKRRSGVGKEKKKKAKKAQLMSQEEMMGAKKDALIQYQADFPTFFQPILTFQ